MKVRCVHPSILPVIIRTCFPKIGGATRIFLQYPL